MEERHALSIDTSLPAASVSWEWQVAQMPEEANRSFRSVGRGSPAPAEAGVSTGVIVTSTTCWAVGDGVLVVGTAVGCGLGCVPHATSSITNNRPR
jgi:hypothetical protein